MIWVGVYFLVGMLVLALLDLFTGRIRKQFGWGVAETQERLVLLGSMVGWRTAAMVTAVLLLMFWPVAIYGAIESAVAKKEKSSRT